MAFAVSSCEKMFDTKSSITMSVGDHEWKPSDTVYSVMGIVSKMQAVADRAVLFGELRGDLVSLGSDASTFLKEIASFEVKAPTGNREENPYNAPVDYYAIINNCNYYLANADTTLEVNKKEIFTHEYGVVLGYRAWAYLQLAQIYGRVPFIDKPIIDGTSADLGLYEFLDIREIAIRLIPEMEKFVAVDHPVWGTVGESFDSEAMFLPNQVILADLYLWAGGSQKNYLRAAKLLHDYLNGTKDGSIAPIAANSRKVGVGRVWWNNGQFLGYSDNGYASSISFGVQNSQVVSYIPMHKNEYDGVTSDLENIFCSTDKNKNRSVATISEALKDICASYSFCSTSFDMSTGNVIADILSPETKGQKLEKGDLRVNYIMQSSKETVEKQNQGYSATIQKILKINPEIICLYRTDLLYLRLAEAYNRAGLHEMAFAILKYGLSSRSVEYISDEELEMASSSSCKLDFWFDENKASFTGLKYNDFDGTLIQNANTMGIHSRGCGFSEYNETYDIAHIDTAYANSLEEGARAQYVDSVKNVQLIQVEDYLVDELAMETCIEGNRFGDLIRFSMHRGDDAGQYIDNEFLAVRVAKRDESLLSKLTGSRYEYNPVWYIPFSK